MALIELQTVTRLRPTPTTDRYGNTVLDWSAPAALVLDNVSVQPVTFTEPQADGRDPVVTMWKIYSDTGHDLDIVETDRVSFDGKLYDVEGEVAHLWAPLTGALDHVEVVIRRVGG